jgi:hypothetical protein
MRRAASFLLAAASLLLAGCDQLGIESASQAAARRDADGRAIGAGCRHAARSVEQCYAMNRRAERAAIFAGWKEMNEYMAENKIEAVPPPPEPPKADAGADEGETTAAADPKAEKPADRAADKAGATDKAAKVARKGG